MKSLFVTLLVISAFCSVGALAAPPDRVSVCHVPPGDPDNFHTITISENALAAHIAHGDLQGACNALCAILCNDGDACTIDDTGNCERLGCPASSEPVNCNDDDACTVDSCNPLLGCMADALDCDDGDACTVEFCDAALGCQGEAVDCDDGSLCTTDSCDVSSGCFHEDVTCDDAIACTIDTCDPSSGCAYEELSCEQPPIFWEDFNAYVPGNTDGIQCDTGLPVHFLGSVPNWQGTGGHAVHAVTLAAGDIALTLVDTNQITMNTGLDANDLGTSYRVSFDAGPAVWAACEQASSGDEAMRFTILRSDDSVLATYDHTPQTWSGSQSLQPGTFLYTGDGTGNVRLRIEDVTNNVRFAGALDNIQISVATNSPRVVFVTSSAQTGAIGGLAAADEVCQQLADSSSSVPSGVYKAFMSDSTTSVLDRFTHFEGQYVLPDGTVIADSWNDLLSGNLDAPIDIDEQGTTGISTQVFTGTSSSGASAGGFCSDWLSQYPNELGRAGYTNRTDSAWTFGANAQCYSNFGMYCFQQ